MKWIVEGGDESNRCGTTRLDSPAGPAQVAVTGAGSEEDFRALAVATQTQPPPVPER